MKIKNANEVKVGDVMVWAGRAYTCTVAHANGIGHMSWNVPEQPIGVALRYDELQDLIDHGFEVTRKVEPVVVEGRVWHPSSAGLSPWICDTDSESLRQFQHDQRVRVTVEPID